MNNTDSIVILSPEKADAVLFRLAHEIYEDHYTRETLCLAAVLPNGLHIANKIASLLASFSETLNIVVIEVIPQRDGYSSASVTLSGQVEHMQGNPVILIDDVLFSGKTLFHGLEVIMKYQPRKVQSLVLIDRGHRRFPMAADFLGIELATTLQEHVQVEIDLEGQKISGYLS